eukprot:CAMPEP_0185739232 /NCGR_PEP_ID=MMETSP1171-20130828/34929_1 /TAXON_ID=374046 /ORGANISM="Helicotheca tamensis, Strain CCMP826" /LENGTH=224 /DNA_ID=CAMNT_0028410715 /DNA_START=82 /DNA_END=753 /DNA_ORIENTATION=+
MSQEQADHHLDDDGIDGIEIPLLPREGSTNELASQQSFNVKISPQKQRGRLQGAKGWSDAEVRSLLQVVEQEIPTGSKQWERVAALHYENGYKIRNGARCKRKFDRLWMTEKSTGATEVPVLVAQAKGIKELISQAANRDALIQAGSDKIKKPKAKRQKTGDIAAAISELGEKQMAASERISSALEKVAESLSTHNNSDNSVVARMEQKFEELENKMDKILEHI